MFARLSGFLVACMLIAAPISGGAQVMLGTGSGGETSVTVTLDSPEAVREAVSQMSDADVRRLLLERLDAVAAEGRPGVVGFVPALAGLGSPHHDPAARGEWTGLALDTTRHDMVRAVVEGIADRVAELARHMEVRALAVDGGLSRSAVLTAALASRGLEIRPGADDEATLRGAAELAKTALSR